MDRMYIHTHRLIYAYSGRVDKLTKNRLLVGFIVLGSGQSPAFFVEEFIKNARFSSVCKVVPIPSTYGTHSTTFNSDFDCC